MLNFAFPVLIHAFGVLGGCIKITISKKADVTWIVDATFTVYRCLSNIAPFPHVEPSSVHLGLESFEWLSSGPKGIQTLQGAFQLVLYSLLVCLVWANSQQSIFRCKRHNLNLSNARCYVMFGVVCMHAKTFGFLSNSL